MISYGEETTVTYDPEAINIFFKTTLLEVAWLVISLLSPITDSVKTVIKAFVTCD